MRIECPACDARYQVPDGQLAAGRQVRCARCGHGWIPPAPPEPVAEPDVAAPVADLHGIDDMADGTGPDTAHDTGHDTGHDTYHDPADDGLRAAALAPSRLQAAPPVATAAPSRALAAAWAVSLAIVVAGLAALVLLREPIARAWPPSARLYAALHLPVAGGATPAETAAEAHH